MASAGVAWMMERLDGTRILLAPLARLSPPSYDIFTFVW
jgi:hypothetical protein